MNELSDEPEEAIYLNLNDVIDDPSDPGSSGGSSGGSNNGSGGSSSDPSWHESEGSESLGDDEDDNDFVPVENLENELYIETRDNVGDSGSMFSPCNICGALKLNPILKPVRSPGELSLKSLCCQNGKIDVGDKCKPSPAAEDILNLWSRDDSIRYVFRKFSRKINNTFLLVSFCANEEFPGAYNPSYKVRGKTYMLIGALLPGDQQEDPAFSQIYVYDADDKIQRVDLRMGHLHLGLDVPQIERQILRDIFVELQEWINECNPYVQQFRLALDMEVEEDMSLVFHPEVPTGCHSRVYNAPSNELCVCATDDISSTYPPVILRRNTTYLENKPTVPELQSIHNCRPLHDIIRYFFFFPDGGAK